MGHKTAQKVEILIDFLKKAYNFPFRKYEEVT